MRRRRRRNGYGRRRARRLGRRIRVRRGGIRF